MRFSVLFHAAVAAALALAPVRAAPVAVGDPSFEGNFLAANSYSFEIGPEWTGTNGTNSNGAFEEFIPGFAAAGTDHLGMENGYNVWQILAATYQPNTRYTLIVAVGNRAGITKPDNSTVYMLSDGAGNIRAAASENAATAAASGAFVDAPPLVFDTTDDPSAVGETICIQLQAGGVGRSHFDNIRLDATPLAPTGAATVVNLPASAITAASAVLNGQVTAIGEGAPAITIFWGTAQGGTTPANWERSVNLAGTRTAGFSTSITGLSPQTTYYFSARATNTAGASWSAQDSFETPPLPPAVSTGAASDVRASTATLAANVTSTGGEPPAVTIYYGPADGGTTPANWAGSISPGVTAGAVSGPVAGLSQATTYYFRAFAQNSGGSAWAANTSSFVTAAVTPAQVENSAPTGITGTTATLRGKVVDTGNDPPAVTIFYGLSDGGADSGAWGFSAPLGTASGDFSRFVTGLLPRTTYYFRSRATNAAGDSWAPGTASFTTIAAVDSTPVIDEIHYHPASDPTLGSLPLEFIELYNPGDAAVDMGNWKLANAVTYTIPAGTVLNPGAFLVIAQDPAALLAKYGATAIGPWSGKLSNSGETIELRDPSKALRDQVTYRPGFPWPTAADGAGPSMELINSGLDNDLGGSWRSSGAPASTAVTYIAASSGGWKYKRGTAEASFPVDAWRALGYNDSSGWAAAAAPFGYGGGYSVATNLNVNGAMSSKHRSVYYRKSFTVAGGLPERLILNIRYDDGFVAWLNGVEIARANAPAGQVPYNVNGGASLSGHPASSWESFPVNTVVNGENVIVGGTNVLCVHSLNESIGSSDYYFDAELATPGGSANSNPTPGYVNGSRTDLNPAPPQIRQVEHSPVQPAAGVPVTITARVTDPNGTGAVTLSYQTVDPGAYIRLSDPAYQTSWTTVPMLDNGSNGDAVAGDSNFTAVLPASVQTNRRLVRYRIAAADGLGNRVSVPYADDEQPNFAYFVYNGVPAWTGALRPASFNGFPATAAVTYPAATLGSIATYQIIANPADVENSQYNGSYNGVRFPATVVYDGVVYDHVQFRNRGIGSTYVAGKNKWKIYFNRCRDLQARDNWGNKYAETWNELNLNANASPWAAVNRGSAGIEEASSARIFELAGNLNFRTSYVQLRVIDDAVEASPADQFSGDLWGLYLAIEPTEGNLLDERGLPDGNIYAIEGNGGDQKHNGDGQPADSSDWNAFRNGLESGGQTEAWYRANMDLDKLYTLLALNRLIGNVDVRPGDNYRYYHRSSDNKWEIMAYDLDMMYIAAHHWGGTMDGVVVAGQPGSIRAIMRHPALAREYRNRCRELMDLLASDGAANGGQIGQLFAEYAAMVNPPGGTATWANLDAAMWNLNPKTQGGGVNSGQSSHKGNFFRSTWFDSRGGNGGTVATGSWLRTLANSDSYGFSDFPNRVQWFVDFATDTYPAGAAPWVRKATFTAGGGTDADINRQKGYGYKYLEWESLYGGYADSRNEPSSGPNVDFPAKPTLAAVGGGFEPSGFSDPEGAGTFAAWQWRIAEISAPGIPGYAAGTPYKYEIQPVHVSDAMTTAPEPFSVPLGIEEPGKTYRIRVRYQDTAGNWSHWSDPAQFVAVAPVSHLVHYWNFNDGADPLAPAFTTGGAAISISGGWLADTGKGFVGENARNGDPAGSHVRINDPSGTTMDIDAPTTGFESVIIRFETRRSTKGSSIQDISYTIDGATYLPFTSITVADADPVVEILDFRNVAGVANNPRFAVHIDFVMGDGGASGNERFDNLTVEGIALPATYSTWRAAFYPGVADSHISGPLATPAEDGVSNLIRYALGLGPLDSTHGLLPELTVVDGVPTYRFRYNPDRADLVWRVRTSSDLTDWSAVAFDSETGPTPEMEDGWVSVALPAVAGKSFARLEIELR